ncbi:MAG: TAT-variant-translocated molybdopterin oxidoreductase [Bacteroidota bacterium]
MGSNKKYWQSLEHLQEDPEFVARAHKEFPEPIPVDEFLSNPGLKETTTSRRDFLKFLGFSVTAASLAACETPIVKSVPYVVKPEEVTPGVANYYASTYADGIDYASIVVKTREGRPILIDGNKLSGVTRGCVSARVNASVLSLYDSKRYQNPKVNTGGEWADANGADVDREIAQKLEAVAAKGGNIRILSQSLLSPSANAAVAAFANRYSGANGGAVADQDSTAAAVPAASGNVKHIRYDARSYAGMILANEQAFGKAVLPSYHFERAKVIVSFGADFLVNWLAPIEYMVQYGENRNPDKAWMSRHYQFETNLSLTGSNADIRGAIKPSEHGLALIALYNAIAGHAGESKLSGGAITNDNHTEEKIAQAADELWHAKGKGLVISDSNDPNIQQMVNAINTMLENYGPDKTIDLEKSSNARQAKDSEVADLIAEMNGGKVDALIIIGADPAYTMPGSWGFADALGKVGLKVSTAIEPTDTATLCDYVYPDSHFLESWSDAEPRSGSYSLGQPTIQPLFKTRQAPASLLTWAGLDNDYHKFVKQYWRDHMFPQQQDELIFENFWNKSLHDGIFEATVEAAEPTELTYAADTSAAAAAVKGAATGGDWELQLYLKSSMGEGNQANNPWLQELPDPITKAVWDNYITMNPMDMEAEGYPTKLGEQERALKATVTVKDQAITLPVIAVPGQKRKTIGIALGYGRAVVQDAVIGGNAYPLLAMNGETIRYEATDVSIANTNEEYLVASTQTHHTMMGRKIVNEISIDQYKNEPSEVWNAPVTIKDAYGNPQTAQELNLWEDHGIETGHRWGMTIDLNTCFGCGACVIACHAENNVPVVGKDEVSRTRTMHWMRIDRYYSSDADPEGHGHGSGGSGPSYYKKLEEPSEYPDVVFQPVMCQHCNHAPCETVCPVAATTHSDEGLNQMTYNRCIGTRYCANNCPFKVRRFNWFNYVNDHKFTGVNPAQEDLGRMVLNPDVVVRSRGVMEKCSMCIQRIQAAKLEAKKAGHKIKDGSVDMACCSACPASAITFGDLNDQDSAVRKSAQDGRSYHLLEEIGVQPNIWYMTKVRNVNQSEEVHS